MGTGRGQGVGKGRVSCLDLHVLLGVFKNAQSMSAEQYEILKCHRRLRVQVPNTLLLD